MPESNVDDGVRHLSNENGIEDSLFGVPDLHDAARRTDSRVGAGKEAFSTCFCRSVDYLFHKFHV
jgi:hypothetical protein